MKKLIQIGDRTIGNESSIFIVAEVGINHNGDMGLACESIAVAAEAGVDSVKFQNYRTEDFISDHSLMFEYSSQGKRVVEPQYDMFKRCELTRDQLAVLKEKCDSYGVNFHSTPTSVEGIEDLQAIGCKILKNGSDYLTNLDLVRAMGSTGMTTVLSTGMATLAEIDEAVRIFHETGNESLILLHCTSSYPTPPQDVNLARMKTLKSAFDVPIGFSDHTAGTTAAIGAVMHGAYWIEKHFTLDRNLVGPDHWFSMDPQELQALVSSVREAEQMVGSANIVPTESEVLGRRDFRLSCVASRNIESGEVIAPEHIAFRRPGEGISPIHRDMLIGLQLRKSIDKGELFDKQHFQHN